MAVLLLAAWLTVLVATLCLVVLPFLLGRLVFSLVHLPTQWTHDTASFAVGLTFLKVRSCVVCRVSCVVCRVLRSCVQTLAGCETCVSLVLLPCIRK